MHFFLQIVLSVLAAIEISGASKTIASRVQMFLFMCIFQAKNCQTPVLVTGFWGEKLGIKYPGNGLDPRMSKICS